LHPASRLDDVCEHLDEALAQLSASGWRITPVELREFAAAGDRPSRGPLLRPLLLRAGTRSRLIRRKEIDARLREGVDACAYAASMRVSFLQCANDARQTIVVIPLALVGHRRGGRARDGPTTPSLPRRSTGRFGDSSRLSACCALKTGPGRRV
jgi:hypothetical protein